MKREAILLSLFILAAIGVDMMFVNGTITGNYGAIFGEYKGFQGAQGINTPGKTNTYQIFKDVCEKSGGRWGINLQGDNTCICPDVSVRKDGIACKFVDLGKCIRTGGMVTENFDGGKDCFCGQGKMWDEQDGCLTEYNDLCQKTGGTINVKILPEGCECREGYGWDEIKGCYSLESTKCAESGGIWTLEGTEICKCPENTTLTEGKCEKKAQEETLASQYSDLIQEACKTSGGDWTSITKTRYPSKDAESRNIGIINGLDNYCSCPNPFGWSLFQGCVKRTYPVNYMTVQCAISGGKWIPIDLGEVSDYTYEYSKQKMHEQRTTTGYCVCNINKWSLEGAAGCYG